MENTEPKRYRFTGHERVFHNVSAIDALPEILALFGYRRVFVVCSRSIHTKTMWIERLRAQLGDKLVGLTDEVGEHSPLSNVLKAARQARDARADVLVSVGGGSVMDMCKAMQLCISENAYDRDALLKLQFVVSADGTEMLTTSQAPAAIRQIAIPTTLATSEWTPVSTPIDDETRLKARFVVARWFARGHHLWPHAAAADTCPVAVVYRNTRPGSRHQHGMLVIAASLRKPARRARRGAVHTKPAKARQGDHDRCLYSVPARGPDACPGEVARWMGQAAA